MLSLLDELHSAPSPAAISSKTPISQAIKDAHTALIRAGMRIGEPGVDLREDTIMLRRYAIWLERVALKSQPFDSGSAALAATLYEFVAGLEANRDQRSIFLPPLNDLLRSALISSMTAFQAHAGLVAKGVLDALLREHPVSAVEQCHVLSARVICALLARQFSNAFEMHRQLSGILQRAVDELESYDAPNQQFDQLDIAVALGLASGRAAIGMLTGVSSTIERSITRLEEIRNASVERKEANYYWLSDRLLEVVQSMLDHGMHRILTDAGAPAAYRRALAQDGYFELWNPQREAIRNGLLAHDPLKHFVVSVPTGAGKTLLAELAILSALEDSENAWAVYVTPSRALVNQVSRDLRRRLRRCGINVQTVLAGAEQSLTLDDELELLVSQRTVTVTTPEKMDAYYRNAREIFDSCRLMVFDEAHKLGDGDRGALLESLISRVLLANQNTRLMLMSGVMSNARELAAWIGEDRCVPIVERRRPVRQVRGVAVRQDLPVEASAPMEKGGKQLRQVEFSGGIVLVLDDDDLTEDIEVDLPNLFSGFYSQQLRYGRWVEDRTEKKSAITDHAVELAESVARAPGTVLVFVPNTIWVEKCAREFKWFDETFTPQRRELADLIAAELGDEHALVGLCLRGVAFHHARLPGSVQRAIEYALEQGWLKAVFATSTLREGINSTATTVIVVGDQFWDSATEKQVPMSEADYANLAGRAGRPRVDTEGRVLLIPNTLAEARAVEVGKRYILAGEAALRVKSQFDDLARRLDGSRNTLSDLPVQDQRLLLGLQAADLGSGEGIENYVLRSLWSFQEQDDKKVRRVVHGAVKALETAASQVGKERLGVAARMGLSLTSAESLRNALIDKRSDFEVGEEGDGLQDRRMLALLEASVDLPEVKHGYLAKSTEVASHFKMLEAWVSGNDYRSILELGKRVGIFRQSAKVGDAVKYCSDISTWLSWTFGAAVVMLDSEVDELDPRATVIPLLVRYGVPNNAAAYISLLGIHDRAVAAMLGRTYLASGNPVTMQRVTVWLEGIDFEKVLPVETHRLRRELLRWRSATEQTGTSAFEFASFTAEKITETDQIVTFMVKDRELTVVDQRGVVGRVNPDDQARVIRLVQGKVDLLSGIVVRAAGRAQVGRLVATALETNASTGDESSTSS